MNVNTNANQRITVGGKLIDKSKGRKTGPEEMNMTNKKKDCRGPVVRCGVYRLKSERERKGVGGIRHKSMKAWWQGAEADRKVPEKKKER